MNNTSLIKRVADAVASGLMGVAWFFIGPIIKWSFGVGRRPKHLEMNESDRKRAREILTFHIEGYGRCLAKMEQDPLARTDMQRDAKRNEALEMLLFQKEVAERALAQLGRDPKALDERKGDTP